MRARISLLIAIAAGCDEGQAHGPPPTPATPPAVAPAKARPPALLGTRPATLGPAFDGLALGQAIDLQAAKQFLQQRRIPASAFVRDGHLVSIHLSPRDASGWPPAGSEPHWFDPALHQHATEIFTEMGTFVQFDLEVPIERWMNTTLASIVRFDLVTAPLADVESRVDRATTSNYVDGHEHVSWIDSALAGAASATQLSVREVHAFRKTRATGDGDWKVEEIPGAKSHGLYVDLDASPVIYDAIVQRLVALFGKPVHDRKTNADTWKHSKLVLTRTAVAADLVHIELSWER
jgi:hypothetical protein